ncbi:MAG: 2-hydroxyacyl-CoA dehydratase, partial [Candidatus Thorarchaeota archaeon]|nr:2-hydroxyacyl-CoA dehydratase [Candidatus Thorarchaeota archaeon]
LQTFACSFIRNMFSQRVNDQLPYVNGIVFPGNTCDSLQNLADIWHLRFPQDKIFRLTYPAGDQGEAAVQYFAEELRIFSNKLEDAYGSPFSDATFKQAVDIVQQFRDAVQFLYAARLVQPSTVPYHRIAAFVREFHSAPLEMVVDELRATVNDVEHGLAEAGRVDSTKALQHALLERRLEDVSLPPDLPTPRIAIIGGMTEPQAIAELVNAISKVSSTAVVFDLLSFGFKTIFTPMPAFEGNPFETMARSVLGALLEPTQEGLPKRLDFLKDVLTHLAIDGLIVCEQSFCDPDEFESPSLLAVASEVGVRTVRLPVDPEFSDRARLEGRIQSFLETLAHGGAA